MKTTPAHRRTLAAQIRMAADIRRKSAAKRETWFRSQLEQLGREIRETLDSLKP